jgi:asparagine synthase (glutamine-hydrolysing)
MCGIAGFIDLRREPVSAAAQRLARMNQLIAHRGPDGQGTWIEPRQSVGMTHRRLSIIDLETGQQPMVDPESGCVLVFNGEIYNFVEKREELGAAAFRTASDTEVILRAWLRWGPRCVDHLRGMFAFALWDPRTGTLFCARDRFGIKPFYLAEQGGVLYFASEAKALLPFLPACRTDEEGLRDYLTFQLCLEGKTMFEGVRELPAAHTLTVSAGVVRTQRYWEVYYELDFSHRTEWFESQLRELLDDSATLHLRADVPLGAYVSGGIDSSLVATIASEHDPDLVGFTGKFASAGPEYDESAYARMVAQHAGIPLFERDITVDDFVANIGRVIYHLDYPVAGPGAFPQYMVSELAARHRKVVLGGQGGDEVFGGYTRYLIAYFEQCIKSAIDGTSHNGNFVVTYESIIPNLSALRNYKPMLQEFWREGLFEPMDRRYFRLINRAPYLGDTIRWNALGAYSPYDSFARVFNGGNVRKESYFDLMTHFDFKTLLPALLQVEDRVSMAHGLEARVPLLDHPLVEFAATIPADVKFTNGQLKRTLTDIARTALPALVVDRKDKMGFPTPFADWARGPARGFMLDIFSSRAAQGRQYVDNARVLGLLEKEGKFGRNLWALFCLELWQQTFHDKHRAFEADAVPALAALG